MTLRETKTILIADDSEFFRTKISDILMQGGYKVMFARDGEEVVKVLKSKPAEIDLLMLDLQMPRINGFDTLKWVRKDSPVARLPVLVITGVYEAVDILKRLKELGATGLITKAATAEQVLFRVDNLLFEDKKEERVAARIPTTIPVDFTTYDGALSTGFMLNLSKTGAFIYTRKGPMPGDATHLRFSIPGQDKLIEVDAEVIWVNRLGESEKNLFKGMGIHFTNITPEKQELIENFVKEEVERLM